MGTRGFLGFVIDEVEKITYNHFDSYPEGLGQTVLAWLRKEWQNDHDLQEVKSQVRALQMVDEHESKPTKDQIEALKQYADTKVASRRLDDWYVLLRETQGSPDLVLSCGYATDNGTFPQNSLFAEWGYIVDLDKDQFEVYRGFQTEKPRMGRFVGRDPIHEGYDVVGLVGQYEFANLPDDLQVHG